MNLILEDNRHGIRVISNCYEDVKMEGIEWFCKLVFDMVNGIVSEEPDKTSCFSKWVIPWLSDEVDY